MTALLLLSLYFVAGLLSRRIATLKLKILPLIHKFILYACLPALVLKHIHAIDTVSPALFLPALFPWLYLGLAFFIFGSLKKLNIFKMSEATFCCLCLTAGFSNTSFLGFPLIKFFVGEEGLKTAVIIDQLGSFFLVNLVGLPLATYWSSKLKHAHKSVPWGKIIFKILTFPSLVAFVAAFALHDIQWPEFFNIILNGLGSMLAPLSLFAIGLGFDWKDSKAEHKNLGLGLFYKLLLGPLIIATLLLIFGLDTFTNKVIVMEMAMPSMITSSLLAVTFDLNPKLAQLMMTVGTVLSLVTLAIWNFLL